MHRLGIIAGQTPDQAAAALRAHFRVGVPCFVEEALRPNINRAQAGIPAVFKLNRREWVCRGHHIGNAVGLSGLHCRGCDAVRTPGIWIDVRLAGRCGSDATK